jgi:phage tail-like protein
VPQPRINVDIDLGLPDLGLPTPTRPGGLPGRGAAVRNGSRPQRPAAPPRAPSQRGSDGAHPDPVAELRFLVELGKLGIGRFRECTGLAAEIECKDYNEGGVNDRVHKLPTRMKYPNLVLKRGVTNEDALLKWLWATQQRKTKLQNITVTLKGPDGKKVRSWTFNEAFPIKWTGPNLNAASNQIATETLEIVHAGLDLRV